MGASKKCQKTGVKKGGLPKSAKVPKVFEQKTNGVKSHFVKTFFRLPPHRITWKKWMVHDEGAVGVVSYLNLSYLLMFHVCAPIPFMGQINFFNLVFCRFLLQLILKLNTFNETVLQLQTNYKCLHAVLLLIDFTNQTSPQ